MKNKIKTYVDHYFRFDKRDDLEALKAEITSNLFDRYDEAITSGLSEQDAYIKTVKSMGDFQAAPYNDVNEEDKVMPSFHEYLLPVSAILAVFSFILIFLNGITGGVLTALSISLYAIGGTFLYHKAMYVKSNDMDIELHKSYLTKIFKYMKTSFAFWFFNIAYLVALVFQMISETIILMLNARITLDPETIEQTIQLFITFSILSFIITLIVMIIISFNLYKRLKLKYYILTGEKALPGKIKSSFDFISGADIPETKDILFKLSFVFGLGSLLMFLLSHASYEIYENQITYLLFEDNNIRAMFRMIGYESNIAIIPIIGLLWVLLSYVVVLVFKKSPHWVYQSFIVMFIAYFIYSDMLEQKNYSVNIGFTAYYIFIPAVLSSIYYLIYGLAFGYRIIKHKK